MTEEPKVPKIVYDRLHAAQPVEQDGREPAHPDADLLTAFAEQALSATERDGVLEHLAVCGDCRELIALALPYADVASAPIADETDTDKVRALGSRAAAPAPRKLSFAWPSLRWAALAAGVVVAASVLLIRPGKLNQTTSPVSPQVATTAQPGPGSQIATSQNSQNASSPIPSPPMNQSVFSAKTDARRPESELPLSGKRKAVTPSPQVDPGMLLADNKHESAQADKLAAAPRAQAFAFDASASRAANETVEVSGAAAAETTPSTGGNLMARNEAPAIEKAKPALQGTDLSGQQQAELSAAPTPAPSRARSATSAAKMAMPAMAFPATPALVRHATWAITAGVLQKSLDGGQSWQSALRPDHPLLCYATRGADVWTGGQAGTLFHSADGGVTWVQMQPSIKGQQLSADVTHIDVDVDVRGPAEVIVSTSNNETWSSTDGGKSWDKK
jgi:hypothetical protein